MAALLLARRTSRLLARRMSSGDPRALAVAEAADFVVRVGQSVDARPRTSRYSEAVARGVAEALLDPSSGVGPSTLMPTLQSLAGSYEIGEDNGLDALASAVERELDAHAGRRAVHCVVKAPGGEAFRVEAFEGTRGPAPSHGRLLDGRVDDVSLYDVIRRGGDAGARTLQEYLECACSGVMACSTCHVYVADAWTDKVGPPCDAELDMLDLAAEPRANSRLGCQLVLSAELEGLELELPAEANNLMDSIPFEDRA